MQKLNNKAGCAVLEVVCPIPGCGTVITAQTHCLSVIVQVSIILWHPGMMWALIVLALLVGIISYFMDLEALKTIVSRTNLVWNAQHGILSTSPSPAVDGQLDIWSIRVGILHTIDLGQLGNGPLLGDCVPNNIETCAPSDFGNVCWDFTCNWARCAIQKCPSDQRLTVRDLSNDTTIPRTWSCSRKSYNSKDGCHCNCGAWDPDCDDLTQRTVNCPKDDMCLPPGDICYPRSEILSDRKQLWEEIYGESTHNINYSVSFGPYQGYDSLDRPIPKAWSCPRQYYASNDGCDCNCGAWDPDCKSGHQHVVNCPKNESMCDRNDFQCKATITTTDNNSSSILFSFGICLFVFATLVAAAFVRHLWIHKRSKSNTLQAPLLNDVTEM